MLSQKRISEGSEVRNPKCSSEIKIEISGERERGREKE